MPVARIVLRIINDPSSKTVSNIAEIDKHKDTRLITIEEEAAKITGIANSQELFVPDKKRTSAQAYLFRLNTLKKCIAFPIRETWNQPRPCCVKN